MVRRGVILIPGSKPDTVLRMEAVFLLEEGGFRPWNTAVQKIDPDGRRYEQEIPGEKALGLVSEHDKEGVQAIQSLGLVWIGKTDRERNEARKPATGEDAQATDGIKERIAKSFVGI